jgi:hypothetical protein
VTTAPTPFRSASGVCGHTNGDGQCAHTGRISKLTSMTWVRQFLPETLGDRQQDNWRSLIAIADAINPGWGEKARAAAVSLSNEDIFDEPSFGVMVLQDVCAIFEGENAQRLSSKTIVDQLVPMPERPWSEWRRGQGLNQNSLARLLKPFGVKSKMIRFAPKPANPLHGYEAGAIREAKLRFAEHSGEEGEGAGPEPI